MKRRELWEEPELLTPGETHECSLELLPTARVFRGNGASRNKRP